MGKRIFKSWSNLQIWILVISLIFYFGLMYYVIFSNVALESSSRYQVDVEDILFLRKIIIPITIFLLMAGFFGYKKYSFLDDRIKISYAFNFSPPIIFTNGGRSRLGFLYKFGFTKNEIFFKDIIEVNAYIRNKYILCSNLVLKNGKEIYLPMSDGKELMEFNNSVKEKLIKIPS